MSQFLVKSPKHCAKKEFDYSKLCKRLFYTFSTFLASLAIIILLIWLLLHPSKPEFYLREANVYQLNLSGPHLLNSAVQITLVSKNPNQKVGVYYDQLQVYTSYKGQQITSDTILPPFYQGHQDNNILTASLIGAGLPVASSFGYEVGRDQITGSLVLNIRLNGRLRWKVGTWVSGRYRLNINCVAIVSFPNVGVSGGGGGPLSARKGSQCSTTV